MRKTYRIKEMVSPYGGRTISVDRVNEFPGYVLGMVGLGRRAAAGLRRYERDEIEEKAQ